MRTVRTSQPRSLTIRDRSALTPSLNLLGDRWDPAYQAAATRLAKLSADRSIVGVLEQALLARGTPADQAAQQAAQLVRPLPNEDQQAYQARLMGFLSETADQTGIPEFGYAADQFARVRPDNLALNNRQTTQAGLADLTGQSIASVLPGVGRAAQLGRTLTSQGPLGLDIGNRLANRAGPVVPVGDLAERAALQRAARSGDREAAARLVQMGPYRPVTTADQQAVDAAATRDTVPNSLAQAGNLGSVLSPGGGLAAGLLGGISAGVAAKDGIQNTGQAAGLGLAGAGLTGMALERALQAQPGALGGLAGRLQNIMPRSAGPAQLAGQANRLALGQLGRAAGAGLTGMARAAPGVLKGTARAGGRLLPGLGAALSGVDLANASSAEGQAQLEQAVRDRRGNTFGDYASLPLDALLNPDAARTTLVSALAPQAWKEQVGRDQAVQDASERAYDEARQALDRLLPGESDQVKQQLASHAAERAGQVERFRSASIQEQQVNRLPLTSPYEHMAPAGVTDPTRYRQLATLLGPAAAAQYFHGVQDLSDQDLREQLSEPEYHQFRSLRPEQQQALLYSRAQQQAPDPTSQAELAGRIQRFNQGAGPIPKVDELLGSRPNQYGQFDQQAVQTAAVARERELQRSRQETERAKWRAQQEQFGQRVAARSAQQDRQYADQLARNRAHSAQMDRLYGQQTQDNQAGQQAFAKSLADQRARWDRQDAGMNWYQDPGQPVETVENDRAWLDRTFREKSAPQPVAPQVAADVRAGTAQDSGYADQAAHLRSQLYGPRAPQAPVERARLHGQLDQVGRDRAAAWSRNVPNRQAPKVEPFDLVEWGKRPPIRPGGIGQPST